MTTARNRPDEDLLARFREGDEAAFDGLVRRHEDSVRALLYRITGNRVDAEDLAQETFLKVYRKAGSFRGGAAPRTWILRIAVNLALDLQRAQQRRPRAVPLDEVSMNLASTGKAPEARLSLEEQTEKLAEALRGLPLKQRAALVLKVIEGLPIKEIAEVLESTADAVKANIYHARKRLLHRMNGVL